MPQSIRDQIMAAIHDAADEGQRAMLLIMLSLSDMMTDVRATANETAKVVSDMHTSFSGITPKGHVDDHGFVARERIRRAEDQALLTEAKKGAANSLGGLLIDIAKAVALVAIGGGAVKLLG